MVRSYPRRCRRGAWRRWRTVAAKRTTLVAGNARIALGAIALRRENQILIIVTRLDSEVTFRKYDHGELASTHREWLFIHCQFDVEQRRAAAQCPSRTSPLHPPAPGTREKKLSDRGLSLAPSVKIRAHPWFPLLERTGLVAALQFQVIRAEN